MKISHFFAYLSDKTKQTIIDKVLLAKCHRGNQTKQISIRMFRISGLDSLGVSFKSKKQNLNVIVWLRNQITKTFLIHELSKYEINFSLRFFQTGDIAFLRQVLFDLRAGNSNLAKSLGEKSNHAMYQDENPHRCLLSLQN